MIACLLLPPVATAQLAPIGVPKGALRLELEGSLESYDRRWLNGERQPFGADVSSPALGSDLFPFLADPETRLARVTGIADYRLNLGVLSTDAEGDLGRGVAGASLGLTRWLSIFGRLPLVQTRVLRHITLDSTTSSLGLNPGSAEEAAFFQAYDAALASLSARIAAGDYSGDPATQALAEATLADGTAIRDDLFAVFSDPTTASPFVPTASSQAGAALTARIAALQSVLANNLGISGFTGGPALPEQRASSEDLLAFISAAGGPIALRTDEAKVTFRGDAEAGVTVTLADRWDRPNHLGGFRAALQGLIRFPTGRVARSDRLFSVGTGEGQTDIEGRLTVDVGGGRVGARLGAGYNRQLAADYLARVAPPTQPFPSIDLLTVVRRDPGDVVSLSAAPFFRLAPTFAIQGGAAYWRQGDETVTYATSADEIPGVEASVLAQPATSATALSIGITYANLGGRQRGGWPVTAYWSYERIVKATGGRLPDPHRIRGGVQLYFGLF